MAGEATVVRAVAARVAGPADEADCCICGRRLAPKEASLQLRSEDLLFGSICPECVLLGPSGAARKLEDRYRLLPEDIAGAVRTYRRKGIETLRALIARKISALEGSRSFPLEARQAAVRALREQR